MLTNKQKQRAEEIRQELAPLCAECQALAKIYNRHSAAAGRAYRVRFAWESVGNSGHARDVFSAEKVAEMEKMRRENPREWSRNYHEASDKEDKAQELARVSLINLKNYISFIARRACLLVGDFADWQDHKAAQSLAEFLRFGDPCDPFAVSFLVKSGGYGAKCADCSACCLHYWGNDYQAQSNEKPQRLTVAKYRATIKKLKQLKAKAEKIQQESRETARAACLWGFVSFIVDIKESL